MPGLYRKILIFAAIDGIIIQPLEQKGQRSGLVKIAYKDKSIASVKDAEGSGKGFEAFGVVGLLTVSKSSFLISIIRRQQVAQIRGKPVYVITEVALTPLSSSSEAELSIARTRTSLLNRTADGYGLDDTDTEAEGDEDDFAGALSDDVDDDDTSVKMATRPSTPSQIEHRRKSSVAENVMTRKGAYGRFAQKWFSSKGWTVGQKRKMGMSVEDSHSGTESGQGIPEAPGKSFVRTAGAEEQKVDDVIVTMLPKLVRTTQIFFGSSRSFFFSYDYDITRSLANRRTTSTEHPLHTEVDPLFFWNRNLIQPFMDASQSSLVLPLMQGFVGQRSFTMDTHPPEPLMGMDGAEKSSVELSEFSRSDSPAGRSSPEKANTQKSFLLTLISRRSINRAGLRYLRRGVDEEGHTANSVETEQILSDVTWTASHKVYSFIQIRGSIPIFFSQSPYSFKPIPQIQHSAETNFEAFKAHIRNISDRYGHIQIASLVEKHGGEAIVGNEYQKMVDRLNKFSSGQIGFEWFDFHAQCRGMKFENVSLLIDSLGDKLDAFNDTVEVDGEIISKQIGVLRTNCMDCLDRTNVVQSACGRRALELQLKAEGINLNLQVDQTTQWFNTLWADNGDAISKQYASTAAMKGDFTRTRKRDFKGALTDMGLSISRFYSGIVNDYFSQAAIDFLLGNVSYLVFEDFEANMMSGDPGVSMQKVRQQAIEVSQKLVVADETEEFIGGWTFFTPHTSNTIKSTPFEEAVLLLTDAALYMCRFDWNIEKVSSFERVDLRHIQGIKYGIYITSTLSPAQADESRNVGLVITYKAGTDDITRVNTRSFSAVQLPPAESDAQKSATSSSLVENLISLQAESPSRILALKALPSRSAVSDRQDSPKMSEIGQVKGVCGEIERTVLMGQVVEIGAERKGIITQGDIISLVEARKSTGLLEQLGHSLKKLVWA